jgi:methionyl-tRNA synthetase
MYNGVKLKAALTEVRRLSQRMNQYLNDKAPWKTIKEDPVAAATSLYVALQAIEWLAVLWSPILPFSSEKVRHYLGYNDALFGRQFTQRVHDGRGSHLVLRYDNSDARGRWEAGTLTPGQAMNEPAALFMKLDDDLMADKVQALA